MTPLPKFFETELFTITVLNDKNESVTMIDYNITQLRIDPDYIFYYMHWLGIKITMSTSVDNPNVYPIQFIHFQ